MNLSDLSSDELDAIATHAGCLLEVLKRVDNRKLLPDFRNELTRLERVACNYLMKRGFVSDWTAEFDDRN